MLGDAEEFDGDGDGDGLGDVLGEVEVAVGDGLVLGEPDGLPDGDVLGSGDGDLQPGDDVPDVPGLVAPGPVLYPVVPPLAGPELD